MKYFDAAATTPVKREAIEAMWPWLTGFGNPSSTHEVGARAAGALAEARATVAEWLGVRPAEITFTSGGTEANNLAIKGIALANPRGKHIVTSPIEHESVAESIDYLRRLHGFTVTEVAIDDYGRVDVSALAAAVTPSTTLVSIMHANNEIGTVNDLAALSPVEVPFHADCVQSAGSVDIRPATTGVSALTISGHKLGAPQGTGALFVRRGVRLEPLLHGGGQERGNRSGTENVAGAVALAAAIRSLTPPLAPTTFIERVLQAVPTARLTGHPIDRLPGHASFTFEGTSGEPVMLELERLGVITSSGSACAAGSDEPSRVLLALGIPAAVAQTAVRFSFDSSTTEVELDEVVGLLAVAVERVRGLR